jgi:hypothetical protein
LTVRQQPKSVASIELEQQSTVATLVQANGAGKTRERERVDRRWEFVGLCRMKRLAEREELVASSSK